MPKFTCNLKKYRQLKELTQEQLAKFIGVSTPAVCQPVAKKIFSFCFS